MGCKAALEASDVPFPSSGQVLLLLDSGPSPTNAAGLSGLTVCMNSYEKRRIRHLACGLIIEQRGYSPPESAARPTLANDPGGTLGGSWCSGLRRLEMLVLGP